MILLLLSLVVLGVSVYLDCTAERKLTNARLLLDRAKLALAQSQILNKATIELLADPPSLTTEEIPPAERALWDLLHTEGVIAEVQRLWAEDDDGVERESITFDEFLDILDEMVPRGPKACVPIHCPPTQEVTLSGMRISYADACFDTDDDGQCPNCVARLGSPLQARIAICPKRGVFG